jgi:hypothetical protein
MRVTLVAGVCAGTVMLGPGKAAAELTLLEKDGWTFFTDGRINTFFSQTFGQAFPAATPDATGAASHKVIGEDSDFTAGFRSLQSDTKGNLTSARLRSGFLGSILALGMKRALSQHTTLGSYIALWGTAQTYARDRARDFGRETSRGFDVRRAIVSIDGPGGTLVAGRQGGILGGISTEIDYLYGHNYGLGLPCLDVYFPTCGHIGTGALGPGEAAGFTYLTPSLGGLRLQAGLFDPVRLLGVWERTPYPRTEGTLTFEHRFSPSVMVKVAGEAMWQYMGQLAAPRSDRVWGLSAGGRLEAGPLRLGVSTFQGKGLGAYVALQNSASTFSNISHDLRYFSGVYAQSALVFGRSQLSAGIGRTNDYQLEVDKTDSGISGLKSQTGMSLAYYFHVTDYLVVAVDYFRFHTDWWGAPVVEVDDMGKATNVGWLAPEKQTVNFLNVGATLHW